MYNKVVHKGLFFISLLAIVGLVVGCSGMAQAGGGSLPAKAYGNGMDESAYTINVNGSGKASVTPDMATVQFGVESIGKDAADVVNDNTTKMNKILEVIGDMGVEDKDVQTVHYNMWVEQFRDEERGNPTGEIQYHLNHQVSVHVHDITKLGKLLDAALQAGANNVGGITFGVQDTVELQSQAREEALQKARAKAEELASGLGVRVGKVRQISEYSNAVPQAAPMMFEGRGGGGEAVQIASGSYDVTVEVQVVFDIVQ